MRRPMENAKPFADDFDAALARWHAGDREDAIQDLEALAAGYPEEPTIHGMLGAFLYQQGDCDEALPHTTRTVELAPRSQLAARVHFHVLYALGRLPEALAELRRFYDATESEESRLEWAQLIADLEAQVGA